MDPNEMEQTEPFDLMEEMDWLDEEWGDDETDLHDRWEPREDEVENLIDHVDFEED